MIGLFVLGALIAVGTVWFLVRGLTPTRANDSSEQHHQLRLVRERLLAQLNELDVQSADEAMDAEVASDERRRLEAELADVLRALDSVEPAAAGEAVHRSARPARWPVVAVLGTAVPLLAVILFVSGNQATLVSLMSAGSPRAERTAQIPPMVLEMVARLEKRLAEQPHDPVGWARLGRSYQVLNRPADSKEAYAKAYQLAPDNIEILSAYAAVLYGEDPQNTEGKVFELFSKLHQLSPSDPGALWFLGLAAYQKGEFGTAVTLWQRLRKQLPADNPVMSQLRHAIARAEERLRRQ